MTMALSPRVLGASSPFSVSCRPSISALAGRPTPCRRWPPVPWVISAVRSLDQILVSQPLAGNAINETVEPLQGMPLNVALIQPKSELVNVPAQMLRADMMEGAVNATLQNGPDALNAVGRNAVAHILASAMIDGFVFKTRCHQAAITGVLVCVQRRTNLYTRADFGMERFGVCSADYGRLRAAIALAHTENRRLANSAASRMELFGR